MRIMHLSVGTFLALLLTGMTPLPVVLADPPPRRGSETVVDEAYLQEVGRQIPSSVPLSGVAIFDERTFASSDQGLFVVEGEQLVPVAELSQPISRPPSNSEIARVST